ncbi:MAG: hypothetical protein IJ025_01275 [Clostridia bacterium]|nr:hypothetical protein [Clostridia bacterium]
MLIIKYSDSKNGKEKQRTFIKRKIKRERGVKRENIIILGKVCSLLEINDNIYSTNELERIFKVFSGKIIGKPSIIREFVPEEYRFCYETYYKRAIVSSIIKNFNNNLSGFSVCIRDNDFQLLPEYADLVGKTKKLVFLSERNQNAAIFSQYCFVEYGAYVDFKNLCDTYSHNLFLDFLDIDETGRTFIKLDGKDMLIYPDAEYFITDYELSEVLKVGVPAKIACAAFETKQQEKINWLVN